MRPAKGRGRLHRVGSIWEHSSGKWLGRGIGCGPIGCPQGWRQGGRCWNGAGQGRSRRDTPIIKSDVFDFRDNNGRMRCCHVVGQIAAQQPKSASRTRDLLVRTGKRMLVHRGVSEILAAIVVATKPQTVEHLPKDERSTKNLVWDKPSPILGTGLA